MRDIEYSTRPITLREHILVACVGKNDFEAAAKLISLRTDLEIEEIMNLVDEEITEVITKVLDSMTSYLVLKNMSKSFEEDDDAPEHFFGSELPEGN